MIKSTFNSKSSILETIISDEVTIDEIKKYIISIAEYKNLPNILKIMTDASLGKLPENIKPEEIHKIVKVNNLPLLKRDLICHALVVSSPKETAFGHLYKDLSRRDNYYFNIFSTKEAAINWLNSF
ncbi:MAG: hypothetical protein L3J35_09825 [Bacteroidales bacterium]|nr:hypothetical protein [Bacteroidales bacterium]